MTSNDAARELLGELLDYGAEALDISPELDARLTDAYTSLGDWIREENNSRFLTDSEVYPQGSRRIGTVTAPVNGNEDCDIDLVYRRDLARGSVTQQALKDAAGEQLQRYRVHLARQGAEVPELSERTRCWTLQYRGFHLDVLPALPDDEADYAGPGKDAIIITDKSLRHWQSSNPKAYAEWFRARVRAVLDRRSKSVTAGVHIEEVPEETEKQPLQRVVQLLKRHRDIFYNGARDNKPISIIITTLAAHAYSGERNVYNAFLSIVLGMHKFIERRGNVLWIPNPSNPDENFADKWVAFPERAQHFFNWLATIQEQLERAIRQPGIDKVAGVLGEGFGDAVVKRALTRLGSRTRQARDAGSLRSTTRSATLGVAGSIVVPRHTFYGHEK